MRHLYAAVVLINRRWYGKSVNLKTGVTTKQSTPKPQHLLHPDTYTCVRVSEGNFFFAFSKTWRALISCNTCFEIRYFVLLSTKYGCIKSVIHIVIFGQVFCKLGIAWSVFDIVPSFRAVLWKLFSSMSKMQGFLFWTL